MRKSTSGFTIVELLVVVVVIGVLASIVVISYNNMQRNARNADRYNQATQWIKMFELYKARYGKYPQVTYGNYCLGTNFPLGPDDQRRCRNSALTDPNLSYLESNNTALMTEIKKIGTPPTNSPVAIKDDLVGPYAEYWSSGMYMIQVFEGGSSDCPDGMEYAWDGNGAVLCGILME